jgi:hypothetical protein
MHPSSAQENLSPLFHWIENHWAWAGLGGPIILALMNIQGTKKMLHLFINIIPEEK